MKALLPLLLFVTAAPLAAQPPETVSRTVVTADLDYPRLLAVARASEPSLILFRNGDWTESQVRTRLAEILAGLTEQDIAQSIIVVDRDRVRRRRLPIE